MTCRVQANPTSRMQATVGAVDKEENFYELILEPRTVGGQIKYHAVESGERLRDDPSVEALRRKAYDIINAQPGIGFWGWVDKAGKIAVIKP